MVYWQFSESCAAIGLDCADRQLSYANSRRNGIRRGRLAADGASFSGLLLSAVLLLANKI